MTKMSGIYSFKNSITGKVYIGSALNLNARRRHHINTLNANLHRNRHWQNEWNKYGRSSFLYRILLFCSKEDLIFFEQRTVDVFKDGDGRGRLYNLDLVAGSALGRKHTEETKAKIGAGNRGKKSGLGVKRSLEHRLSISRGKMGKPSPLKGRTIPEETKKQISSTLMGHSVSEETRFKIGHIGKGRHHSEQTKLKMSLSRIGINNNFYGKKHTAKSKEKISRAKKGFVTWMKGKHHSEESKAKIREAKAVISPETRAKISKGMKRFCQLKKERQKNRCQRKFFWPHEGILGGFEMTKVEILDGIGRSD